MSATVVVGGQFGSEGKGKISAYLAKDHSLSIRTGGPNAGHTFQCRGRLCVVRTIPCAVVNPQCHLGIAAGAVIDLNVLLGETASFELTPERLTVDGHAAIIDQKHVSLEKDLTDRIASTGKGVGSATAAKVMRSSELRLAKDIEELSGFIGKVTHRASLALAEGQRILIEGTQGFGLSLHHGTYPYVTSRDTTASGVCSEAGVSPRVVSHIVLVVRTFPIRVAGPSGPLPEEIDWHAVTVQSGAPKEIVERTTVTNRIRRVARFDMNLVHEACLVNRPTYIALTFADYLGFENFGKRRLGDLSQAVREFVDRLEEVCECPVLLIGTGPGEDDLVDRR